MPRIIVKCTYYSSAKSVRDIGGMLKYIATRENVESPSDSWKSESVSKAQEELILKFCKTHKECRKLQEYVSYEESKTKGSASELISAIVENYPNMLYNKTYLDYIATRPRVERIEGKHGLFTKEGVSVNLEEEAEKLRQHKGNVFTIIVSLKRNDAERLGYNYADRWKSLVQSRIDDIAKEYKIPPQSMKWFGAFHNESHHPHIHLMLYSTDRYEKGFIDKKGIDNLRHIFGTEIFADDLNNLYKNQTEHRNLLNSDARKEVASLAEKIRKGLESNDEFIQKFIVLAKRLQSVPGKKVYGYLPKTVKAMVNELVDILEKDKDIDRIYELWYQAKCAVYATYTDNPPPRKPLSQEEAFKPIRNAIIKEADELGKILDTLDDEAEEPHEENTEKPNEDKHSKDDGVTPVTNNDSHETKANRHPIYITHHSHFSSARKGYIATSITRFAKNLSDTFRRRFYEQAKHAPMAVDSRLKREIEAKKKGQRISM